MSCGRAGSRAAVRGRRRRCSTGQSLVALDLCARLTTGRPLPDGAPALEPSNVIVFNGEDGAADTVAPRLQAAKKPWLRLDNELLWQ